MCIFPVDVEMTVARRVPNTMLRELLAETGWTGDALARAINAVGAESGLSLRYGRSSVAHWLAGMRPWPPVPELAAEAFSRKLGRRVSISDTGLARPGTDESVRIPSPRQAGWEETDAVSRLVAPQEVGAGGSAPLAGSGYRLSDLAVPSWMELSRTRQGRTWGVESAEKVERWQVRSAIGMVGLFSDADFAFGGGHARLELSCYLAATIAPWLRATATPAVRRELLTTASRLTYLCGFMYFDDELHGAAQHYYLTNLQLVAEAGDATAYAVTLRALSGQARSLGHHREAVHLAEAAVQAAPDSAGPQTSAFLFGQLAVAHAADGNHREAARHMITAERLLERAGEVPEPVGGYDVASLAHQQAAVRAKQGDRRGAIQALMVSIRLRPAAERRSRAITLARLAELQLDVGELEAACGTWQRFLLDYPYLRSRRVNRALASMRARLRPHQNNSAVIALRRTMASLNGGGRQAAYARTC
jgi:tetratricopeptide (TPR) repeat protein